jgi:hypothetical protein
MDGTGRDGDEFLHRRRGRYRRQPLGTGHPLRRSGARPRRDLSETRARGTIITDIIGTLEQDLSAFAVPQESSGGSWKGGRANPTPLLTTIQALLGDLAALGSIGSAIATVNADIATALGDASTAITLVADTLSSVEANVQAPATPATALQNGLAVAQSLMPGSSPALTSGSQFFGTLSTLLADVGNDVDQATTQLYQIAQQLTALATAF